MHKKNYVEFARMIRKQKNKIHNDLMQPDKVPTILEQQIFSSGALLAIESTVNELVDIFQNDNPAFDVNKFLSACEIEEK